MAMSLFICFVTVCLFIFMWAFADPKRLLSCPFIVATAALIYISPQLAVVVLGCTPIAPNAAAHFILYGILAVLATIIGFHSINPGRRRHRREFDEAKLRLLAIGVGFGGLAGFVLLRLYFYVYGLPVGPWRGWPVYLYTLSRLLIPALVLFRELSLRYKRDEYHAWSIAVTIPMLINALILGRRTWMLLFIFSWFMPMIVKGMIEIRRWHAVAFSILAFLVITLFPAYRNEVQKFGYQGLVNGVTRKSPKEVLRQYFSGRHTIEVADSICCFTAIESEGQYSYGRRIWDSMVNAYLPGHLVGRRLKDRLRSGVPSFESLELASMIKGHWPYSYYDHFYTSKSGFVDSFAEFWWFGILLYFFLGRYGRVLFRDAVEAPDPSGTLVFSFVGFMPAYVVYGEWGIMFSVSAPALVIALVSTLYASHEVLLKD